MRFEFVDCTPYSFRSEGLPGPHTHADGHELSLITHGHVQTQIGDRVLEGGPGDVLLYPQGMVHAPRARHSLPLEMINLRWRGGDHLAGLKGPAVRADCQGRLRHQLTWMLDLYPGRDAAALNGLRCLAQTVLLEFGRLADPAPSDLSQQVVRFIRSHLGRGITVDALAAHAGLSRYHFSRRIKAAVGRSPMQLVSEMRVDAARDLIAHTELSLETIAAQVGVADASHLSHLFQRVTGRTPGSFRSRSQRDGGLR